ncbi:MAG: hypothetical protein IAC08_07225 [Bacteroidetes bacterium]|uniref:Carbohydrate-binding domain-containing protein n=1 Tax=Candidatus Cryptobacteroides intestinigallinarum TaxID=2840767 RepID=A0A9D9HLS8_9BACT|nr:hypothetical protein [Candidatus Cryptobacteroides intestinigallinarum]
MKSLMIPLVQGLEAMPLGDREIALELHGTKASVDTLNWQQDWPYCPAVHISVARSLSHLFIAYHVHGLDLRAQALEYNGPVWEDSCCEFFVSDPHDGTYYNFEMNCIGTLLAAKRKSRTECTHFEAEKLDQVIKYSSLKREKIEICGKIFSWDVAMGIPFSLIGMDGENLPKTARANFFKCADKAAHPHFLSWNPIDVPSPDFHRPDFFGELIF